MSQGLGTFERPLSRALHHFVKTEHALAYLSLGVAHSMGVGWPSATWHYHSPLLTFASRPFCILLVRGR